jgi:uncharacterized protein
VGQLGAVTDRGGSCGRSGYAGRPLPDARNLLLAFDYVSVDDEVVDAAMNEPDRMLRSLDAIHLATARVLRPDLDGLATYDDQLAAAAKDAGIPVVDPRD